MYAEVAVNATAPLRQTFTYRIPEGLDLSPGHAVYVPFGPRTLQGIVTEVGPVPAFAEARDIEGVIDERPLLTPERIALARWISDHYLAPLFDCLSLMLPAGFKRKPLTYLQPAFWLGEPGAPEGVGQRLSDAEQTILAHLREHGETEVEALKRALPGRGSIRAIGSLIRSGHIARTYRLARPPVSSKSAPHLRLTAPEAAVRSRIAELKQGGAAKGPKLAVLLEALADESIIPLSRARRIGATPAVLRDLQADGTATVEILPIIRDPLAGRVYPQRAAPALTRDQQAAAEAIRAALHSSLFTLHSSAFLLHGVTGSGKTEVYLAALDHAVALGRRAIVLVPEIALTPQTVRRFAERFPGQVAVLHSEMSLGEQFDVWHEVRDGRFQVVIGARGALFAPQPDLGIVIIDEEHEWTYKQQDASPRYHARAAAEELCRLTDAVLVLGSATPDVETHFRARSGALQLLELPERLVPAGGSVRTAPLPDVEVVDLREELKAGNRGIFSRDLTSAIRSALGAREQVILFLNRRGTASFVQCRDCGHVPECRSCAVALTYHAPAGADPGEPEARLVCHYCNRRYAVPAACAACKGTRVRQVGLGTERVEEEVHAVFPGARTVRWDRDVTGGRDSHESILARFLAHEADILIGTQMVAKGLDIPLVTLVGVVSADIALHLPDFRAGERTFQLLEQVAGRAGRGERGGRVIIQTYTPDHYAIEAAARHNYHALYEREIDFRRRLGYPPFGRLVRLTFAHTNAGYARDQATLMARRLRAERGHLALPNLDILGPAPAFVPRIRGRWRWNVVLRGTDPTAALHNEALPRGWTIDVDPASLL